MIKIGTLKIIACLKPYLDENFAAGIRKIICARFKKIKNINTSVNE